MTTVAAARRIVKPVVLFHADHLRSDRTAAFGAGLAPCAAVGVPAATVTRWATDAEYREHFLSSTLSRAEWDARLDEMAAESAATDALCRGLCFA